MSRVSTVSSRYSTPEIYQERNLVRDGRTSRNYQIQESLKNVTIFISTTRPCGIVYDADSAARNKERSSHPSCPTRKLPTHRRAVGEFPCGRIVFASSFINICFDSDTIHRPRRVANRDRVKTTNCRLGRRWNWWKGCSIFPRDRLLPCCGRRSGSNKNINSVTGRLGLALLQAKALSAASPTYGRFLVQSLILVFPACYSGKQFSTEIYR